MQAVKLSRLIDATFFKPNRFKRNRLKLQYGEIPELSSHEIAQEPVSINAENLRQYLALCQFPENAGIPASYPHLLGFKQHLRLLSNKDFPFPMGGLVHVANTIRQYGRINPDDTLLLSSSAANLQKSRRGYRFDLVSRLFNQQEQVWEDCSVYQYPIKHKSASGRQSPDRDVERKHVSNTSDTPETLGHWSVSQNHAMQYARISKDFNPIHLSNFSAKMFGLNSAIAHGMFLKSRCLAAITPAEDYPLEVSAKFLKPVCLSTPLHMWRHALDSEQTLTLTDTDNHTTYMTLNVRQVMLGRIPRPKE